MASLINRNGTYYLQWYEGINIRRRSLRTGSLQIAKEERRQFESAQLRGAANPLPTRTPVAEVLEQYVQHIRTVKTPKAAQNDIYYLREAFGPICTGLTITSRRQSPKARKRPKKHETDRRCKPAVIAANCFEEVTTTQIATFIEHKVRVQGLAHAGAHGGRPLRTRAQVCRRTGQ